MPEVRTRGRLAAEWRDLLREAAGRAAARPAWLAPDRPVLAARRLALFAQLEEVLWLWSELRAAPLDRLQGRFVTAAWTLKDLLGHLASWAAEFRREVEGMARGEAFDYAIPYALSVLGPNAWNAAAAERQRPASLEGILEQFIEETGRIQDLVLALAEERLYAPAASPLAPSGDPGASLEASIAQIVLGKCVHDRHHLGRIAVWLEHVRRVGSRPQRGKSRSKRRSR
jgi:uncharacterized damage-inducible protein DinB